MTWIPGSGIFGMTAFSFSFLRCLLSFKPHPAFFLWAIPVKPVRQPLGKAVTVEGSLHSYLRCQVTAKCLPQWVTHMLLRPPTDVWTCKPDVTY